MRLVGGTVALVGLLACQDARYIDRPTLPSAATLIFFVHDDEKVERAVLVDPAEPESYPELLQLDSDLAQRTILTVIGYALPPAELGLRAGRLLADPSGRTLPDPDEVLALSSSDTGWRVLDRRPPVVRNFRTVVRASSRCHPITPVRLQIRFPPRQAGDFSPSYVAGTALTSTSSLVVANGHGGIFEISTEFAVKSLTNTILNNTRCLYSPARTGTTAIGACKDVFRVHVEGDLLVRTPWRYDLPLVYADDVGNMAGQRLNGTYQLMDRFGTDTGALPAEPYVSSQHDVASRELYRGELFLLRKKGELERLTVTGTIAELVQSSTLTHLAQLRDTMYAGDMSGAVLRRHSQNHWEPAPQGSDLNAVKAILPAEEGLFVVWSDGLGAEYLDRTGWCPKVPVSDHAVDVTVRLGTGYLLGDLTENDLFMTWLDLGLPP
ncbi:MAG: hypothetical protein U1E65_21835 [Myxococcota bacterium]